MKSDPNNLPSELAPCGIYCGACPSFEKSCHGCSSDKEQKRKSKWACQLRTCCYTVNKIKLCFDCNEFPCNAHRKKLIDSHPGDPRFEYRHEIAENLKKYKELGLKRYLEYMDDKWRCSSCNGRIHWYSYKCIECGMASHGNGMTG